MSPKTTISGPLTAHQAAELLQVSLSEATRPIDVLVERLSESDAEAWLQRALNETLSERHVEILQGINANRDEIAAVKSRAKDLLARASNHHLHLTALACYCLAVARGLVSCNKLMSSRSGEEWAELFADLAGVLPPPWREMISQAAEAALRDHNS